MNPVPTNEWTPTTAKELSRIVTENFGHAQVAFTPVGGRTSFCSTWAIPTECAVLSTNHLQRIVDYPSRDMTITVEAGIRVESLQEELAKQQQRLPIDIPQAGRATLGGAIAANTSASSRYGYGTFRDYVIGISAVDGQGKLFSAGGRVVKNVAGYDLCKLLIGSQGTLATITEVTLKLRPLAESKSLLIAAFSSEQPLEPVLVQLNKSTTRPVILDICTPKAASQMNGEAQQLLPTNHLLLCLGFEGTENETAWQIENATEELNRFKPFELHTIRDQEAKQIHEALTEFQISSDDPVTFHASVPRSQCEEFMKLAMQYDVSAQAHAGNGIIHSHLPDRCTNVALANEIIAPLRAFAEKHSGALTIVKCDAAWVSQMDLFGKKPNAWKVMSGIKHALDPAGLLLSRDMNK